MNTAEAAIFTHPITIFGISILCGLLGWILNAIFSQGKAISTLTTTSKNIESILSHVVSRQDEFEAAMAEIGKDLAKIVTEHEMVKNAGNLLHSHGQKKTEFH